MKKYKFKLDAVLKIREAREKKIKMELGEIVKEMQNVQDRISQIESDVDLFYGAHDECVESPTRGRMLRFYPEAVKGLKLDKDSNRNLLQAIERRYERKVQELKNAMGEVKVINKLKEKDLAEHRRQVQKKELETLEEIVMLRPKEKAS
jgi:flagellar protein FliJ